MTARLLRNHDRRAGIGASELSALAGSSPYATPVAVWLEKVGLDAGRGDSPAMRAGRELEGPILRAGALAVGERLTHNAQTFGHPDWPAVPLFATPDGFGPGRRCTVEVKLVGHHTSDWADGPPEYVALQAQGQMAVAGADHGHVIALVGAEIRTFILEPDPTIAADLPAVVVDWWQRHVVAGIAPEAGRPGDAWALLRARAAREGRPERLATADEQLHGAALVATLAERDRLEAQADSIRLALAAGAEAADIVGLGWVARWGIRSTTDWRALAGTLELEPDLVAQYVRATPTFTFRRTTEPER